ncbi:MAG: protein containing Six-hairpin glycosidase-like domain protein [Pseudomonadota bacterium]|nr:protein containing Six-hairpin glycosidase-like domain protein [Pseudomonadota bacterium]
MPVAEPCKKLGEGTAIKGHLEKLKFISFFIFLSTSFWLIATPKAGADRSTLPPDHSSNHFIEAKAPEKELLLIIRKALCGHKIPSLPQDLSFTFQPDISQVYITLLQSGRKPLRWGARRTDLAKTLARVTTKIRSLPRFAEFHISDTSKCRLLFEIITSEKEGDITVLDNETLSANRYEPGITGLKYTFSRITRYFMPTDAVMHSIMSVKQLLNYIAKKCGIGAKTNKINERIKLLLQEPMKCKLIVSKSWISFKDTVLPLYRGTPELIPLSKELLYVSFKGGIDWLYENMNEDGSFLYYYDGIKNSQVDFIHPQKKDPLYYNILRHSGGTIALLWGYELTGKHKYLKAAKRSLDYLLTTFVTQTDSKEYACFPFFNHKSKLGGAGIGLVALVRYTMLSKDYTFTKEMSGLVRHLLSRIDDEGEMIGYYLHPLYNDGKPIINPSPTVKKELFSFYYPGEALLGLALYYRHLEFKDEALNIEIRHKSKKALDFLVQTRPLRYAHLFTPLPADAWLMQAIEEWVKVPGFKKKAYINFVFDDANAMWSHMYNEANALYSDYPGGFYYNYGDHVYHDASRCEGLMAAYGLAKYLEDDERARQIKKNVILSANGIMNLRNTPESTFAHLYPEKSNRSFRFKLTRAWIRVDSTQHAVCFFARLYKIMP